MLDTLITSKTRIKLLLKFFINPETRAYLRGLAEELGESTNAVRIELNRLTQAGLLESNMDGRTKLYGANKKHPLFPDIQSLVKKNMGLDKIESIISELGSVEIAFISGDCASGVDSGIIDLIIVGSVDRQYLQLLVEKSEEIIKRKIRVFVLSMTEFESLKDTLKVEKALVIWQNCVVKDKAVYKYD